MADDARVREGDLLWSPTPARVEAAQVTAFGRWLRQEGITDVADYREMWRWSVDDLDGFWDAILRWSGVELSHPATAVLGEDRMPGAVWFPGATLNYAAEALRHDPASVALVHRWEITGASAAAGNGAAAGAVSGEGASGHGTQSDDDASRGGEGGGGGGVELTYGELAEQVRRCAAGLRRLGVGMGDRVAAYVPNRPEAVVGLLATASLGAVWTACSPDFGSRSVLDRFRQVEPVVLLAVTGYRYGGRHHDRSVALAELVAGLPTVRATVLIGDDPARGTEQPGGADQAGGPRGGRLAWHELLAPTDEPLEPVPVPFDHPLWVLYTSGTTGLPKSIVHGHGGVVLELNKLVRLHLDLGPQDRFFWFSTTGWVMWNIVLGGLLVGAAVVTYDGNPSHPHQGTLWDVAGETRATFVGTSAGYVHACVRAGLSPAAHVDLSQVRTVGVTGSPLSPAGNAWLSAAAVPDAFVASISGGTDVCTAFLGGAPVLGVRAGHLQHACLGVAATAFDEFGLAVAGQVGELVITRPMPSMPVGFWGSDGDERYRSSYFDTYPGVWRHGDWVRFDPDGSCVVMGRSDATLNRGGVRMGSSEFYAVLDTVDGVADSLVIDTTAAGADAGELVLLVAPHPGVEVDDALVARVRDALRSQLSPRHVPDRVLTVGSLPHTLNGKRLEVPIRRLFLGADPATTLDRSAIDDPHAYDEISRLARRWLERHIA